MLQIIGSSCEALAIFDGILLVYLPLLPIFLLSGIILLTAMLGVFKKRWRHRSGGSPKKPKDKSSTPKSTGSSKISPRDSTICQTQLSATSDGKIEVSSGWTNDNEYSDVKDSNIHDEKIDDENLKRTTKILDNCKETHILEDTTENKSDLKNGNYDSLDKVMNVNFHHVIEDGLEREKTDCVKETILGGIDLSKPKDLAMLLKDSLEIEIGQLQTQLQVERNFVREERDNVRRLELEAVLANSKDNLIQELNQERTLRCDAERRLEDMRTECDGCRVKVSKLQDDFRKMEEIVRHMLAYKARFEQMRIEKSNVVHNYESKMKKYESCMESLQKENALLVDELKTLEANAKNRDEVEEKRFSEVLLQRLQYLEEENASLAIENDRQRQQYERCLDDVANQVVQALLSQKTLREECGKLQTRVADLEYQNKSLNIVFLRRINELSPQSTGSNVDATSANLLPSRQWVSSRSSTRYSFPGCHKQTIPESSSLHAGVNQSDQSSDSLASLCSNYSFVSSASSCATSRSQFGTQRLSSPPAWFNEADSWIDANTSIPSSSSIHRVQNYNPDTYSSDEFTTDVRNGDRKLGIVCQRWTKSNDGQSRCRRPDAESTNRTPDDFNYVGDKADKSLDPSPSEFFDSGLDAVETPNDEVLGTDDLSLSIDGFRSVASEGLQSRPNTLKITESIYDRRGAVAEKARLNNAQALRVSQSPSSQFDRPSRESSDHRINFLTSIDQNQRNEVTKTTGNDSGESGNKDEGYSTMSSDVQIDTSTANNSVSCQIFVSPTTNRACHKDPCSRTSSGGGVDAMNDICEEEENDDFCVGFAQELASSVVKRGESDRGKISETKSTMELLSARQNQLINLFSPQGYKNRDRVASVGKDAPSVERLLTCPVVDAPGRCSDATELYRASSDSRINSSKCSAPENRTKPVVTLKQDASRGVDYAPASKRPLSVDDTSLRRTQHRILNDKLTSRSSFPRIQDVASCSASAAHRTDDVASEEANSCQKWIWEWEPINASEECSDLNSTDAGFFMTSLPPLPRIREDGSEFLSTELSVNSSPESTRRRKANSFGKYKKKVASVSPFKYESFDDSDKAELSGSASRLSWCSEELNLQCSDVGRNRLSDARIGVPNADVLTRSCESVDATGLETKFTTDFYRLCPADSNRSLSQSCGDNETTERNKSSSNRTADESSAPQTDLNCVRTDVKPSASRDSGVNPESKPDFVPVDKDPEKLTAKKCPNPDKSAKPKSKIPSPRNSPVKSTPSNRSSIPVAKKSTPTSSPEHKVVVPCKGGVKSKIIVSPPKIAKKISSVDDRRNPTKIPKSRCGKSTEVDRAVESERKTTERIVQLNRMLADCGALDDTLASEASKQKATKRPTNHRNRRRNNKEGCVTSWVHVEADVDLSDPKARANLLDTMLASSSSTEDSSSDDDDTIAERQHLHELHRFRRRKKRAESDKDQVVRFIPALRPSIVNCPEFFYRYGEKEREAVSCFDFLDELSTTPSSGNMDDDGDRDSDFMTVAVGGNDDNVLSPITEETCDDNKNDSRRLSLSDTCAEGFSSSSSDHSLVVNTD